MNRTDSLFKRAAEVGDKILDLTRQNKNIILVSHLDADGIISASIIAKAVYRKRGRLAVRIVSDFDKNIINILKEDAYDFHIICDLAGGLTSQLETILGNSWMIIDHHQIPEDEIKMDNVFNIWQFGYDGSKDICSAGLAYLIAREIDETNVDLSWLAVVAAVADRQDQNEGRSLGSLNKSIVEEAEHAGFLNVSKDLIFYGRSTKPIHKAIASSSTPFIQGITGNEDVALKALKTSGLKLQDDNRWRTISELTDEEKKRVMEAIIPYLTNSPKPGETVEDLIGSIYTLTKEDEYSYLRDSREFATLLNACGRMRAGGIGVSICMGDRSGGLKEGERTLMEYRKSLGKYIRSTVGVEGVSIEKEKLHVIVGDEIIDEYMIGSFTSILGSMPNFKGKHILVKTITQNKDAKISVRRSNDCNSQLNFGLIMRDAALLCNGNGGGHEAAAGAKIPESQFDNFLKAVEESIDKKL